MVEYRTFFEGRRDFYHQYGSTLAYWAAIEEHLGLYFIQIAGLHPDVGWAIYHSSRSFLGRVDMLSACIPHAKTVPAGREFLLRAVTISRQWVSARNSLAHDTHVTIAGGGRDPETAIRVKNSVPLKIEDIRCVGQNFMYFCHWLREARGRQKLVREPELCLELLGLLGNDPLASVIDQTKAIPLLAGIRSSTD